MSTPPPPVEPQGSSPTGIPFARVREARRPGTPPALYNRAWSRRWPWLVQGITTRGVDGGRDMALFGQSPTATVLSNWEALGAELEVTSAVHARQVHGAEVVRRRGVPGGLTVAPACDGHWTTASGVLLTVSVADCVPVYLVCDEPRAVSAIHAGWRGAAAGILEAGLDELPGDTMSTWVHLGPSICGACYEVGPEVHEALGEPVPPGPTPVDLRTNLARRAVAAGVPQDQITISELCTLCRSGSAGAVGDNGGDEVVSEEPLLDEALGLFSHRGGDAGRQVGFIAIRDGVER